MLRISHVTLFARVATVAVEDGALCGRPFKGGTLDWVLKRFVDSFGPYSAVVCGPVVISDRGALEASL